MSEAEEEDTCRERKWRRKFHRVSRNKFAKEREKACQLVNFDKEYYLMFG